MELLKSHSSSSATIGNSSIAVLPGFLRLPIELRQYIYALTIDTIGSFGKRPQEPPISLTSRQLRTEALPVYYNLYPLTIQTYVKRHSYGITFLTTNRWYHRLEAKRVSALRRLKLRFGFLETYFGEPVTIEFAIVLSKRRDTFEISHTFGAGWFSDVHRKGDPEDCREVLLLLKAHVCGELDASIASPGIGHFTAKDLDRLVALDPDTLP